jgi:hypothetical protein
MRKENLCIFFSVFLWFLALPQQIFVTLMDKASNMTMQDLDLQHLLYLQYLEYARHYNQMIIIKTMKQKLKEEGRRERERNQSTPCLSWSP